MTHSLVARTVDATDFPTLAPLDFRDLPLIRIGHDLDGCHWSFRDAYTASLRLRFPGEEARFNNFVPGDTWDFFKRLNQTFEEFVEHYEWAMSQRFLEWPEFTVPGAVEATRDLSRALGERVEHNIATDRSVGEPFAGAVQTAAWAAAVDFPFTGIRIDRDKTVLPNHVFVDDRFENYVDLRRKGIRGYLLTQPWNVAFDVPAEHRVSSVAEFCERVHDAATVTGYMA